MNNSLNGNSLNDNSLNENSLNENPLHKTQSKRTQAAKNASQKKQQMKTLHLLTQASLPEGFDVALAPQDGLILLAEGVSHIHKGTVNLTDKTYVIAEDLAVRGLENSKEEIATISYDDLPDLVFEYDRNITW